MKIIKTKILPTTSVCSALCKYSHHPRLQDRLSHCSCPASFHVTSQTGLFLVQDLQRRVEILLQTLALQKDSGNGKMVSWPLRICIIHEYL